MIQDVTIPAHLCTCEAMLKDGVTPCAYQWVSTAATIPTHCQNRECRSRQWNGVKPKKVPEPKPAIVLPRPVKVRGGEEDGSAY